MVVPAAVPSLFHSSVPALVVVAVKNRTSFMITISPGNDPDGTDSGFSLMSFSRENTWVFAENPVKRNSKVSSVQFFMCGKVLGVQFGGQMNLHSVKATWPFLCLETPLNEWRSCFYRRQGECKWGWQPLWN